MNLLGVMEVSGSALKAERMRAEVVAANMANAETTRTADGGPYRRQDVVFAADHGTKGNFQSQVPAAGGGVFASGQPPAGRGRECIFAVVEDPSPPLKRYDPEHPDAGPGWVRFLSRH